MRFFILFWFILYFTVSCEDAVEIDRRYDEESASDLDDGHAAPDTSDHISHDDESDADSGGNIPEEFTVQWGDEKDNYVKAVAVSNRGIYVAGEVVNPLNEDVMISLLDRAGNVTLTVIEGSSKVEQVTDIEVDYEENLYVTGMTEGSFNGSVDNSWDILLMKFSNTGDMVWSVQTGTEVRDRGNSVTIDRDGNIYVCGFTEGLFDGEASSGSSDTVLVKVGPSGKILWTKQFAATDYSLCKSIEITESQFLYLGGYTEGVFGENSNSGSMDSFILKLDLDGNIIWSKIHGTKREEYGGFIAVDSLDNVYITGQTSGIFENSETDVDTEIFLTKFDKDSNHLWTRQWGTSAFDKVNSITVDSMNNVYVTGSTYGAFEGSINIGLEDVFLAKFSSAGKREWVKQFGTHSADVAYSVAADFYNNLFIAGNTKGVFNYNPDQKGSIDAFLIAIPGE